MKYVVMTQTSNLLIVTVLAGVIATAITGCGSQPVKPPVQAQIETTQGSASQAVLSLLAKADAATNADRLQQPLNDNAVDRLRAARFLAPDYIGVDQGFAKVVTRYLQLSQQSLAGNQPGKAKFYFQQASVLLKEIGSEELTVKLGSDMAALDERLASYQVPVVKPAPEALEDNAIESYPLDVAQLASRSSVLAANLAALAQRLRFSGESMMIVARTDGDARWVYKQMRKAVPGYRLRGDIKTGREPRIEILPPI